MSKRLADVALIDADARRARALARGLREQGLRTSCFVDGDALLLSRQPYGFRFFVLDLLLDRDGRLIRLLRRRSNGGVLAFGPAGGAIGLRAALSAGADMFLALPLQGEDVALAVRAVQRRLAPALVHPAWELDARARRLRSPSGQVTDLSEADARVLGCLAGTDAGVVTREALARALGLPAGTASDNLLHATIYRLRRRVRTATDEALPLRAVAGTGYAFQGRLRSA